MMKRKKLLSWAVILTLLLGLNGGVLPVFADDVPPPPGVPIDTPMPSLVGDFLFLNGVIYHYEGAGGAVTIPSELDGKAVTEIASKAFEKCSTLTSVSIPSSVTKIGENAFADCNNLENAVLAEGLEEIGYKAFYQTRLKSISIPDSVVNLGGSAFQNDTLLADVKLPNNLKVIPMLAFDGCLEMSKIRIPEGIETIDRSAFFNTGLTSITIPATVTSIGQGAFGGFPNANKLKKAIFLGVAAPTLGANIFENVASDLKVYYPERGSGYDGTDWTGFTREPFDPDKTYQVTYDKNDTLATGDAPVDNKAYKLGDTATVTGAGELVQSGYKIISWNTLANGSGISYIPGEVIDVETSDITLYAQWSKVSTITIDPSVTHGHLVVQVDDKNVSEAAQLETVNITAEYDRGYRLAFGSLQYFDGKGITIIQDGSFTMPNRNITVSAIFEPTSSDYSVVKYSTPEGDAGQITKYFGNGGNLIIPNKINGMDVKLIADKVFEASNTIKGVTLPEGTLYTGEYTFRKISSLTKVSLPDSLWVIGRGAFEECTSLGSIRIPANVASIRSGAFRSCPSLKTAIFEGAAPALEKDIFDPSALAGSKIPTSLVGAIDPTTLLADITPTDLLIGKVDESDYTANKDFVIYHKSGATGFDQTPWTYYTQKEYKYLIKYKENGAESGIVPSEDIIITPEAIAVKGNSGNLAKAGYTLASWNTKADGTGKNYAIGSTINKDDITADITLYAKWSVIQTGGNGGGGGGGSAATTQTQNTAGTSNTATTEAKSDANGKATASVSQQQVADAVKGANAQTGATGGRELVKIVVKAASDSKSVETNLPKAAISSVADSKAGGMSVETPIATLSFDDKAMDTIAGAATGDIKIAASKVDASTLSAEAKAEVGDRPVYNFTVTSGDKTISEFGGTVNVSVPYTPKQGEDTNAIVIYYVNAKGELEMVKNCVYDPSTGKVTFGTTHFSTYAVGYNKVAFQDVSGWYADYVSYLVARDIIKGKAEGIFAPNANITRAEFVQILANMAGANLSQYTKSSFGDVDENAWYKASVGWAADKGIVTGTNGKFNPNANITRQEMAVMLDRYVKNTTKTTLSASIKAVDFNDGQTISSYAKASVATMQQAGIIAGKSNNFFEPNANATRAEVAKMTATLIKNLLK